MLAAEEGAFVATLERGQKILEELLVKAAASKDKVGVGTEGALSGWRCRVCGKNAHRFKLADLAHTQRSSRVLTPSCFTTHSASRWSSPKSLRSRRESRYD